MSEMVSGLHHVALIASDYASSKRFYTQILGLPIIAETYREKRDSWKLDLEITGGGQLELFSFPITPQRPSTPEACGLRHLAFCVHNLNQTVADLVDKGVEIEPVRIDPLTGSRFTFFADPDGLPIELYEI